MLVRNVQSLVCRAVWFPDDRSLITASFQVTVDTVGGYVQRAITVPIDGYVAQSIVDVFDLSVWSDPTFGTSISINEQANIAHTLDAREWL